MFGCLQTLIIVCFLKMLDNFTFLWQGKVKNQCHNIYELVIMMVAPHFKHFFFKHGPLFLHFDFEFIYTLTNFSLSVWGNKLSQMSLA